MKVPAADKRRSQVGGKDVLTLDIVGYRVVTPCDGKVVISLPEAADQRPDQGDKAACKPPTAAP